MDHNLILDPDFQEACPKQTDEEISLLRESLLEEGCRDAILFWKDDDGNHVIVDGMTRFAICTEEGIDFNTRELEIETHKGALRWILKNQLGRRNLTSLQRSLARGRLYNELKTDAPQNNQDSSEIPPMLRQRTFCPLIPSAGGSAEKTTEKTSISTPENSGQKTPKNNVAEEIAEQEGVSPRTVRRDGKLVESLDKLSDAVKTQLAGTKVEQSRSELERLTELSPDEQKKVARLIGSGRAKTVNEAKKIAKINPKKLATPDEVAAAEAKAQLKIWYDTLGRWLGRSTTIDDLRERFPSNHGDKAVKLAADLYEALKVWSNGIK